MIAFFSSGFLGPKFSESGHVLNLNFRMDCQTLDVQSSSCCLISSAWRVACGGLFLLSRGSLQQVKPFLFSCRPVFE